MTYIYIYIISFQKQEFTQPTNMSPIYAVFWTWKLEAIFSAISDVNKFGTVPSLPPCTKMMYVWHFGWYSIAQRYVHTTQVWHNLHRGIAVGEGTMAYLMFVQFLKANVRPVHVSCPSDVFTLLWRGSCELGTDGSTLWAWKTRWWIHVHTTTLPTFASEILTQWIGIRENLQETMVFTIKYRGFL